MSTIRRSYQPKISPFPPDIQPASGTHTHARTISASVHLPAAVIPLPHSAPADHSGRPRPDLRIITSFPTPPRRCPALVRRPDASRPTTSLIHHPKPIRHSSIPQSSSLPILKRKAIPALYVLVDTEHSDAFLSTPLNPPVVRTSHSLEKRMNREAVIISREMYTSYDPSRLDSYHWKDEAEEPDSPHISPPTHRRSGRGHKRTLSDKFKSLFSPSPPKALSATLLDDRKDQGRMCDMAVMEVEEVPERIGMYDESDIPTLSAIYPQPDEAGDLVRGGKDENGQDALLRVAGGPDRPYRSPGTASFLVHRMDGNAEQAGETVKERETRDARRNTFGVKVSQGGDARVFSPNGSEVCDVDSGEDEADDEMSSSECSSTDVVKGG